MGFGVSLLQGFILQVNDIIKLQLAGVPAGTFTQPTAVLLLHRIDGVPDPVPLVFGMTLNVLTY